MPCHTAVRCGITELINTEAGTELLYRWAQAVEHMYRRGWVAIHVMGLVGANVISSRRPRDNCIFCVRYHTPICCRFLSVELHYCTSAQSHGESLTCLPARVSDPLKRRLEHAQHPLSQPTNQHFSKAALCRVNAPASREQRTENRPRGGGAVVRFSAC